MATDGRLIVPNVTVFEGSLCGGIIAITRDFHNPQTGECLTFEAHERADGTYLEAVWDTDGQYVSSRVHMPVNLYLEATIRWFLALPTPEGMVEGCNPAER